MIHKQHTQFHQVNANSIIHCLCFVFASQ